MQGFEARPLSTASSPCFIPDLGIERGVARLERLISPPAARRAVGPIPPHPRPAALAEPERVLGSRRGVRRERSWHICHEAGRRVPAGSPRRRAPPRSAGGGCTSRSGRSGCSDPVLICREWVPTARSAIVVSSVSPERCRRSPWCSPTASRALSLRGSRSRVPIWFTLMRIEFALLASMPFLQNRVLVTKRSSPTSCTRCAEGLGDISSRASRPPPCRPRW